MSWRRALFDTVDRVGRLTWDIPAPPAIIDVVEGTHGSPPAPNIVVTNIVVTNHLRSKQLTPPQPPNGAGRPRGHHRDSKG
jgi:hypothetical protein